MSEYHNPVLLKESVDALIGRADGAYADATFGGGGHSREILSRLGPQGTLMAFDRDADAAANAPHDNRFTLIRNNFRFIHNYVLRDCPQGLDGILADLGVSSHQLDTAQRGFSFRFFAPLDMRMNSKGEKTAADIINAYPREELERVLWTYGEVSNARQMAALIEKARDKASILTTGQLDEALAAALPRNGEHKVLAKVYQALRIEVNDEMRSLEKFLEGAAASLKQGGVLAVITYHSLEDRMVKNFIRQSTVMEAVNRKPIVPCEEEIRENTRARSAKLRAAIRI